jgi:hypothetical protein
MKQLLFVFTVLLFPMHKNQNLNNPKFKAQRVSKTASIDISGSIEKVFPLFGAFEERKWADKWDPTIIYPSAERIEEGTAFKTNGHGHGEQSFMWIVTKYQLQDHLIQYLVSTENRYWTITIKCRRSTVKVTTAEITYEYTGLNATGNQTNQYALQSIYKQDLKDWEKAINYYLDTGKTLKE